MNNVSADFHFFLKNNKRMFGSGLCPSRSSDKMILGLEFKGLVNVSGKYEKSVIEACNC